MKKYVLIFLMVLLMKQDLMAQLTGIKTIPGDYATITAAVAALNASGVGAGGVTFNIAAGHTETGNKTITATGTAANPIIFQKSGVGVNPTITAGVGTGLDAIFKMTGSDYVTFDGITIQENPTNTTNAERTEYGFAFFKPNQDNGCQYNTIKNCTISLSNTYYGTDPTWGAIYQCFGIVLYSAPNVTTNLNTEPSPTTIAAGNSFNLIQNNAISNVSQGIYLVSNRNIGTIEFADYSNQFLSNTITNVGGHSGGGIGIQLAGGAYTIITGNSVTTNVTHSGGLIGISNAVEGKSGTTVSNNSIQLNAASSGMERLGIFDTYTGLSAANGLGTLHNIINNTILPGNSASFYTGVQSYYVDNVNIEGNTINLSSHPTSSGTSYGVNLQSAFNSNPVQVIKNNIVQNNISPTTDYVYGIYAGGVSTSCLIEGNKVINNNAATLTGIYAFIDNVTVKNNLVVSGAANQITSFTGLQIAASNGTTNAFNNYFGSISNTVSNARGINILNNTTTIPIKIYHNTTFLSGSNAGSINSAALSYNGVPPVDLRNNIFVNKINPGVSGRSYAFQNGLPVTLTGFFAKNNLFYAGTPGPQNLIYGDGGNDSTLLLYKLKVCVRDSSSVTGDVPFLSFDYTNPNYLHINPTVASLVNNMGVAAPEVTVDYDGQVRSATTPDIGADELNGIAGVLTTPLTPPVLWLKADAGVYNDAGITLATAGQQVQQWNDQSCNGFNATQPILEKRPYWQPSAFNGKPALWFDGTNGNYWLENTVNTPVPTTGSARTYFVVAKAACSATGTFYPGGHLFTNRRNSCASTLEFVQNGSGIFHGGNLCSNHPEATSVNFSTGQNQPFVGSWRTNGTGSNLDFWFNSTAATTANANFIDDNGSAGYCVGDRRDAFQFDVPTGRYDWQGHIAEIIVYNRALTDGERQSVEMYLQNKYDVTGLLPQFTGLPSTTFTSTNTVSDASWMHTYRNIDNSKVIVSINANCANLGTINSTVYNDATAGIYGGMRYMRRHYVINPTTDPVGTKRVRLYYTNADFADLQTYIPTLTSASQLVITKYDGTNEDGVFDPTGGTVELIPSSQITTGTVFGVNYLEFDVTGFSEFWIHTGFTALPLQFLSFSAQKCNNSNVCLTWQTANEQNVSHFEIERSIDGLAFSKIGATPANNQQQNSYRYTDDISNVQTKQVYYRIKQVDINAKTTNSIVQLIKVENSVQITIYPNPVANEINITNWSKVQQVQLVDVTGKMVKQWQAITSSSLQVNEITAGVYFVKIKLISGEMVTQKLIKQ